MLKWAIKFVEWVARTDEDEKPQDERVSTESGPIATVPPERPLDRYRKLIESFDEDRETWLDRGKRWISQGIAVLLPFLAIFAVSQEVGSYFSGGMPFSWSNPWTVSMYTLAYGCESGLAALTFAMAGSLQKKKIAWSSFLWMLAIWTFFDIGSGVAQIVIAVGYLHATDTGTIVMIWLRVGMVMLFDLASVAIFAAFRGKSLDKFLASQGKKAVAIRAINESELEIERAQQEAERRRQEEQHYLDAKRAHEQLIVRLMDIHTQAIVSQAEQALLSSPHNYREVTSQLEVVRPDVPFSPKALNGHQSQE